MVVGVRLVVKMVEWKKIKRFIKWNEKRTGGRMNDIKLLPFREANDLN